MFEAIIDTNKRDISFTSEKEVVVDGETYVLDEVLIDENKNHFIVDNKCYTIELVNIDKEKKFIELKVNNRPYQIKVKDQFDLLLSKLGMADLTTKKVKDIKAPMPGLVVDVLAKPGQEVKEGDNLLILEAMKMENSLKSPVEGIIKSITVKPKDTVDKNQVLILFE